MVTAATRRVSSRSSVTAQSIERFVDWNLVYTAESLHKIMMNAWPVDSTAAGWAGTFVYPGSPLQAKYEWVRYEARAGCAFSAPVRGGYSAFRAYFTWPRISPTR